MAQIKSQEWHDLIVTAIGINGGSAVIPVSQASGPVILKVNSGPFMLIHWKQDILFSLRT